VNRLRDAAEILPAKSERGDALWLFNVIRAVDREELPTLDDRAVFRLNPIRSDVYCGRSLREAVELSNLHGLWFREVRTNDPLPMI
jgi:hypothetical protein